MAGYCTSCGAKVEPSTKFCGECGEPVEQANIIEPDDDGGSETVEEPLVDSSVEDEKSWRQYLPATWKIGIAGVFMGLIAGGLLALALANIGGGGAGFFAAFLGVTLYLWQKPTATGAIGSGLYISALLLILVPLLFYGGMLAEVGEDPQTAEETGMAIGGVLGLVIWGFVFTLVAIVVGAIGYFFKRREKNKLKNN